MYIEEFSAAGALTAEIAEDLVAVAGHYTSRITITSNGRTVNVPLLATCWDVLRVGAGSTVSVTAESGYHPPDIEDRSAIRDFVSHFQKLTADMS